MKKEKEIQEFLDSPLGKYMAGKNHRKHKKAIAKGIAIRKIAELFLKYNISFQDIVNEYNKTK